MIFATVGTHQQPFDRMLAALERLPDPSELVVQYGHGHPPKGAGKAVAFMSFEEIGVNIEVADCVITHAGVGSILRCHWAGHTPIVVPRLKSLGEHVDDHQMELTEALAAGGAVVPVRQETEIADVLDAVPPRVLAVEAAVGSESLALEVRKALEA